MAANRPVLLDLFCKAGGAAMGYHRAGFEVVGVDIEHQPNYPFEFHRADALDFLLARDLDRFDAVHASPPCQFGTAYKRRPDHVYDSPNLIPQTRERLYYSGLPYVIENLWLNRAHLVNPVRYCGSSFGLDVQRHRAFESSVRLLPPPCNHGWQTPRFPPATNRTNLRSTVEVGVWRIPLPVQQRAMGITWMSLPELSEAIPPRVHRAHRSAARRPHRGGGGGMTRLWDVQWDENWWLSLGFHFDHTDPSLTLHLPGVVLSAGRCKQPGFKHGLRRSEATT